MVKIFRGLLIFGSVLCILFIILFFVLSDQSPTVISKPGMHFSDLKRVQSLVREFRPSNLVENNRYVLTLNQRELDLIPITALSRYRFARDVNFSIKVQEDLVEFITSYPVTIFGLTRWINSQISFSAVPGSLPEVNQISLSSYLVPEYFERRLQKEILLRLPNSWFDIWQSSQVKFSPVALGAHIAFTWNPSALALLPDLYPKGKQLEAVKILEELAVIGQEAKAQNNFKMPLNSFLKRLLSHWTPSNDNLDVLMVVLTQYISNGSIGELYAIETPDIEPVSLYLSGRRDLARHFLLSAMLTSQFGESIAGELGYLKELSDADNKDTGFSASDLFANSAGVMFFKKLDASVANGSMAEFLADLDGLLLPNKSVLRKIEESGVVWDEVQIAKELKKLSFYSTKKEAGRHK